MRRADGSGAPLVLVGAGGELTTAAFSPEGGGILTLSSDGTAEVWSADGQRERIVLSYGPYVDMSSGDGSAPPDPTTYRGMPNVVSFVESIVETSFVHAQLDHFGSTTGYLGWTPIQNTLVLDEYLEPSSIQFDNQYLLLGLNGVTDQTAPYFRPAINGSTLAVQEVESTLFENFVGTVCSFPFCIFDHFDLEGTGGWWNELRFTPVAPFSSNDYRLEGDLR